MEQGVALQKAGDDAGAEAAYRRAMDTLRTARGSPSSSPSAADKLLRDKNEADARFNLAWLFAAVPGRSPEQAREAVDLAERAVELDPDNGNIWYTLALARYRVGDWPAAEAGYRRALAMLSERPPGPPTSAAARSYRDSLEIAASNSLAWLWATCPDAKYCDGKRAVELATRPAS